MTLQLVVTLPTASATARMRIWRALKGLGCGSLRDGVYLLPRSEAHGSALQRLADECVQAGGTAWLLAVEPLSAEVSFETLFDRADDYAALRAEWSALASPPTAINDAARLLRRLEREFDAVRAIDFFPGDASLEAQQQWLDVRARLQRVVSPDEPIEAEGDVPRLNAEQYQGRTWATRKRLWVDRVASAWLIRRFVDPQARFLWLDRPEDCPPDALGFDFDGATFTHVGGRVTFETLVAAFGLSADSALGRLGAMVHVLDVGGEPVPEAKGFEVILTGARERLPDDDALLSEMGNVLDSFYAAFQRRDT